VIRYLFAANGDVCNMPSAARKYKRIKNYSCRIRD
jgi:hypothetical protein